MQPDGLTIEIQVVGDEYYHYTVDRADECVRENENGFFELVGPAPTEEQARIRRAQGVARRQREHDFGTTPNLAPKGIVILANFADLKFDEEHTQAVFDELCNAEHCTVNTYEDVQYPSAAEYFSSQSNGTYRPQFDVFGPVTLSHEYAYYGKDKSKEGDDQYAATAVVEACILANEQYSDLDFANYDSDNDGDVDFVYVIYAGLGQADGGDANTIWPHNWTVTKAIKRGYCTYNSNQRILDEKRVENYAMSAELSREGLGGIGTLCHEFGHVMGLPDLYDTNYGVNYDDYLTPNDWDVMDQGAYGGDGHCPPNYDPWEKYFFGWVTPVNLGNSSQQVTLGANGTKDYNVYQINASGELKGATTAGLSFYIENRQQQGWDTYLPGHGLVIWKVDFNASDWQNNTPNNTANKPRFTIVSAYGTQIASKANGVNNPFPGGMNVTSWSGLENKPLMNIVEADEVISLLYMINPEMHLVQWMANGELVALQAYPKDGSGELHAPSQTFEPCAGTTFIGWTANPDWCDPFEDPDDLFTDSNGKVTQSITYYALFE
jgi:M6 family metalloprotease-like protein